MNGRAPQRASGRIAVAVCAPLYRRHTSMRAMHAAGDDMLRPEHMGTGRDEPRSVPASGKRATGRRRTEKLTGRNGGRTAIGPGVKKARNGTAPSGKADGRLRQPRFSPANFALKALLPRGKRGQPSLSSGKCATGTPRTGDLTRGRRAHERVPPSVRKARGRASTGGKADGKERGPRAASLASDKRAEDSRRSTRIRPVHLAHHGKASLSFVISFTPFHPTEMKEEG